MQHRAAVGIVLASRGCPAALPTGAAGAIGHRRRSARRAPLLAVLALLLGVGTAVTSRAEDRVVALRDAVVVRQSPSDAAPELARIDAGATLRSFGERGGWLNVALEAAGEQPTLSGWVRREDVADAPPASGAGSPR